MSGPLPLLCYYRYSKSMTGGARDVLDILTQVDAERFRPFFVSQRESPLAEAVRARGFPVEIIPVPEILDTQDGAGLAYGLREQLASVRAIASYTVRIREVIRRHGAGMVWARNARSVMLIGAAARSTGVPLVWDIGMEPPRPGGLMRLIHWYCLAAASLVVTQSVCQSEQIFGPRVARRFAQKFQPILAAIDDVRAAGLRKAGEQRIPPATEGRVLCLASIARRKNQMMLLRAMERAVADHPHLVVRFAGAVLDPAYLQELRAFVSARGLERHVEFLGWRDDVPQLLARTDVLVLCSDLEGIPQVVREAMLAGLPVVATRIGGNAEAVDEGVTGYLVDQEDDLRLAEHLITLFANPALRTRMGEAAARIASERFAMSRWSERYNTLLAALLH